MNADVRVILIDDLDFLIEDIALEDVRRLLCLQAFPGAFRVLEA